MADVSQISPPDRAASGSTGTPSRLTSPPRRATASTTADSSWRHCPEHPSPNEIAHERNMERLRELPDVRMERVQELRKAIADGSLETPERLATAIERMIAENTGD